MASKNDHSNGEAIRTGAIEKLMATVPHKVSLPGSSEYVSSINSYFFKTAQQSPAYIFAPVSEEDVSVAVELLSAFPEVKIAIRGGGHTPNPFHNNIESSVTFDLRGLNTLHQSEKRQDVVEVGAGCDWDAVYELLEKSGRSAVGSREPSVGVDGFVTGGGLSFFSPEHEFACDNVVNFQVVLASGDIVSNNMVDLQHVENPEGLRRFEEIQPQIKNTMRLDTTRSHRAELQEWQPINQYALYITTTIKITTTIGKKINDIWHAATLEVSNAQNITSCLTYQQFPPQKKDNPNGMGLNADAELHKDHLIVIISVYWHEADQTDRFNKAFKDAMENTDIAADEENALHPYRYCNYASWWQNPLKTWGANAVQNLAEVSRKYDSNGFFQKHVVGYRLA